MTQTTISQKLTLEEYEEICRWLRKRYRYAAIAKRLNLSLWTITRVATELRYRQEPMTEEDLFDRDAPPGYRASNLHRCPTCGGLVYLWPCLGCRLEERARREKQLGVQGSREEKNSLKSTQHEARNPKRARMRKCRKDRNADDTAVI